MAKKPKTKQAAPRGRATDLERFPAKAERFLELVAAGCSTRLAADLVKVAESTIYLWLVKGAEPGAKKVYLEFSERYEKARQDFVLHHLNAIKAHSGRSFQASAWALERCLGEHFGQPSVQMRLQAVEEDVREVQQFFRKHNVEPIVRIRDGGYAELGAHACSEEAERNPKPYRQEQEEAMERERESRECAKHLETKTRES